MTDAGAPYRVVCFGEVLWDCLDDGRHAGGAPLNVANHLAKMNCSAVVVSAVGDDDDGQQLLDLIRSFGLDTSCIEVHKKLSTGTVIIDLNDGIPTYTIVEPVAWDAIDVSGHERALCTFRPEAIIYGSLSQRSEQNRRSLDRLLTLFPDALRVFDVNLRPPHSDLERVRALLSQSSLLKVNEEELAVLTMNSACDSSLEARARFISDTYGCREVCVTQGDQGASLLYKGEWLSVKGNLVDAVDTVGAGDAFLAALLASRGPGVQGRELALHRANQLASFVSTRAGATPKYRVEEVLGALL